MITQYVKKKKNQIKVQNENIIAIVHSKILVNHDSQWCIYFAQNDIAEALSYA